MLEKLMAIITQWIPFSLSLALGILLLFVIQKILTQWAQRKLETSKIYYQLTFFFFFILFIVVMILSSPLTEGLKAQLLSLLGIFFTAAIALSSTTFLGNILAGLMIKVLGKIRPGDFVKIENNFGRITELGLLHTEIQTIDRDLTTLPNLYLVNNPVKVLRSSGTVISEEITLGYDVHHNRVEKYLLLAAQNCRLEEPFMHIQSLGDYSVTYRISGFLKDLKTLLSSKAKLREEILDALHGAGIEIVSPSFMNQRVYQTTQHFIPKREKELVPDNPELPEGIIFDKADEAESIDILKGKLVKVEQEEQEIHTNEQLDKESKEKKLSGLKRRKEYIEALIKKKKN